MSFPNSSTRPFSRPLDRRVLIPCLALVALCAAMVIGVAVGPVYIGPARVWDALVGHAEGTSEIIVRQIRLPRVLVLAAAGQGQFIAERDNAYMADVLKKLGARNLVSNAEQENFRFLGFTDYSEERILEKNPDVIFTINPGGPVNTRAAIKASPSLSNLTAVKENRVHEVDAVVYLQSAGPRLSQMLDELPKLLYPAVFATAR